MTSIRDQVIEKFGADGTHWSCLGQGGEHVLSALLCALTHSCEVNSEEHMRFVNNGLRIVEIGTHRGVSSTILARYGSVLTLDVKNWELREEVWKHFGVRGRIQAEIVSGNDEILERLKGAEFDLAFIDGNHSLKSIAANFEAVKKCGRVIFHDYKPFSSHLDRTVKFVDEIRVGRTTKIRPFAMWERWEI